jgi:hypothetical protein
VVMNDEQIKKISKKAVVTCLKSLFHNLPVV